MTTILDSLSAPAWRNIVFTLLHSLWLGVGFALALGAALRVISPRQPRARYAASLLALAGFLVSGFVTHSALELRARPEGNQTAPAVGGIAAQTPSKPSLAESLPQKPETLDRLGAADAGNGSVWIALAAIAWLLGLGGMLVRFATQFIDLRRVLRECAPCPDPRLTGLLADLARRMGVGHPVRLASSSSVGTPSVFGLLGPVILLPVSFLAGIPAEQMRAVLAHELAHIRRHDFVVNVAQQIVEALLFFNPAVWWISRQIRVEREACCDAMAVEALGERGDYARALAELVTESRAAALAMPAFGGSGRPGGVLDRLKRLLLPQYQPAIRLPWSSFLTVLLVSGFALVGAWRGSRIAVAAAAEWLTPAQRIAKIETLRESHGEQPRVENDALAAVAVAGKVRAEDGSPLPKSVMLRFDMTRSGSQSAYGLQAKSDGSFAGAAVPGTLRITVQAAGFAPGLFGPFEVSSGAPLANLDLALSKGYSGVFRLLDPQGRPLPGAKVGVSLQTPGGGGTASDVVTDANGLATIDHVQALPLILNVSHPGFQVERRSDVVFKRGETVEWRLQPAMPTSGVIVASATENPIASAEIKLLHQDPFYDYLNGEIESAPVLAVSDSQGRFSLASLRGGVRHALAVLAPGHAPLIVPGVLAGQSNLKLVLGPELFVKGTIKGDLSLLRRSGQTPVVDVENPLEFGRQSFYGRPKSAVVVEQGGVASFEVKDIHAGRVNILAGSRKVELMVDGPVRDLVIDLAPPPVATPVRREVVVRLVCPPGGPTPRGALETRSWTAETRTASRKSVPLVNGEARFQVDAPCFVGFDSGDFVGYWVPEEHMLQVPAGEGAFVVERRALPAGALFGEVLAEDGSPLPGALVGVVEVEKPPTKQNQGGLANLGKNSASSGEGHSKFLAQPLPLGGKYLLVAHIRNRFAASPIVSLTEQDPIQEVKIRLAKGGELGGVVVDEAGLGLRDVKVGLNYSTHYSHDFVIEESAVSDHQGRFAFHGINTDLPGGYEFTVRAHPGYRPVMRQAVVNGEAAKLVLRRGDALAGIVLNHETGNPLAGVEVYVLPDQFKIGDTFLDADGKTDNQGRFKFSTLEKREYRLSTRNGLIRRPGPGGASDREIRVRGGQTNDLVIRLEPAKGSDVWELGKRLE